MNLGFSFKGMSKVADVEFGGRQGAENADAVRGLRTDVENPISITGGSGAVSSGNPLPVRAFCRRRRYHPRKPRRTMTRTTSTMPIMTGIGVLGSSSMREVDGAYCEGEVVSGLILFKGSKF